MKRTLIAGLILLLIMILLGSPTRLSASGQRSESTEPQVFGGAVPPGSPQARPDAPIGFALDDGTPENSLGFGNSTYNTSAAAIWLNGFAVPASVPYPLTLTGIQIAFPGPSSGNFVGDNVRLLVYLDADSDGNPGNAALIYQSVQPITVADWYTFQYFPINLVVNTRGDLYVGWEDAWAEGGPSPREYIAALDQTVPQHQSWFFAARYCCTPNIGNLSANYYKEKVDSIGFPGNFMVRLLADSYTPATPTPLATATPLPPRCPGERFTDVCPGDYFYQPVLSLNDAGIIAGYQASPPCITPAHIPCYLPFNNVTRGQTAKIVSLAAGFTEPTSGQLFEDIPPGSTFYDYIQRLASRGIINGYPCGGPGEPCVPPGNLPYFRPGNSVTRGQLSKMTSQAFGYSDPVSGQTFEDVPAGSTFYAYIERMAERGIINGYQCGGAGEPCVPPANRNYFRPNNPVTRGQTAKILYIARSLVTPTPTITPSPTATVTHVPTATSTVTAIPTSTPSETYTASPTDTVAPTVTATSTTLVRR